MASTEAQEMLTVLRTIDRHLVEVTQTLQRLANSDGDSGPNYYRPLTAYPGFDWSSVGATVVQADQLGATIVRYQEREYKRRSRPKFGKEVWFSRGAGRSEDGDTNYVRLITFSDDDVTVEPLPEKITSQLTATRPPPTEPQRAPSHPRVTSPAPNPQPPKPARAGTMPTSELDQFFPRNGNPPAETEVQPPTPGPAQFYKRLGELKTARCVAWDVEKRAPVIDEITAAKQSKDWSQALKALEAQSH